MVLPETKERQALWQVLLLSEGSNKKKKGSMKIAGVIAAKGHSKRFEGKNLYPVDGIPMFQHSVRAMQESMYPIDIHVCTDSQRIASLCDESVNIIWRGEAISEDEQPLFDVIKHARNTISERYDIYVVPLANTINLTGQDIDAAIRLLKKKGLWEVRGYGTDGQENGLLVLADIAFLKHEISSYVGAIVTPAKEIHYEDEIKKV